MLSPGLPRVLILWVHFFENSLSGIEIQRLTPAPPDKGVRRYLHDGSRTVHSGYPPGTPFVFISSQADLEVMQGKLSAGASKAESMLPFSSAISATHFRVLSRERLLVPLLVVAPSQSGGEWAHARSPMFNPQHSQLDSYKCFGQPRNPDCSCTASWGRRCCCLG